jgi:hypothetical protein
VRDDAINTSARVSHPSPSRSAHVGQSSRRYPLSGVGRSSITNAARSTDPGPVTSSVDTGEPDAVTEPDIAVLDDPKSRVEHEADNILTVDNKRAHSRQPRPPTT